MKNRPRSSAQNRQLMKVGRRVFLAGVVATASGCQNMIQRGQSPDEPSLFQLADEDADSTKYIGDIVGFWGWHYATVHGVGLAVDLNATGSSAKSNSQREHLLRELELKTDLKDAKGLMASTNTELVILEGKLPPGIREGERFDLEVVVMGNTEATSIENGMVLQTSMQPMKLLGRSVKEGHIVGVAQGRILVDNLFESRKGEQGLLRGVILGGGRALEDRPMGMTIRTEEYSHKTTTQMSRAINARFTIVGYSGRKGVSEPKTDRMIELVAPDHYLLNIGRYLGVIKNIAYMETSAELVNRIEELDREIGEPATCAKAAIRLEAIGKPGVPALKRALRHHDLEVQFHAAQALAYSGEDDGVDILKKAAKEEPAFRWHAMAALAALGDISAASALSDLMHVESVETRYGAFRAMRAHSPKDPTVAGQWLAGDFYLHEIVSEASPMLHFSRSKRAEIVVFGDSQTVTDDFLFVEPGLTVRGIGNGKISITLYAARDTEQKKTCSTRVGDLIRTMANLGYGYGSIMKMFQEAKKMDSVNTRIVLNAVPKLGRTYSPDDVASDLKPEKSKRYVTLPMPELFQNGDEKPPGIPRVAEDTIGSLAAEDEAKKKKSRSRWHRMKQWFVAGNEE